MASNALGSELISRTVGYKLTTGQFQNVTPNLPQRIALLGEANTANQITFPTDKTQITTSQQAGQLYGFGSPIHMTARILLPVFSDGVGGIPVFVYPQAEVAAAIAKEIELTVTGAPTASATHTVIVAGRGSIDSTTYNFDVAVGDTVTDIASAIADAVNNVLSSPMTASSAIGVVTLTAKWAGFSSDKLTVSVDKNDKEVGTTYASVSTISGLKSPLVTPALDQFGNEWNTIVLNTYGVDEPSILDELEVFNGIPDPNTPTGRYSPQIFKPFIALTGSTDDENTILTDARKDEVTIAVCPAPLSGGLPMEAAANMCVLFARISQDTPELDVAGRSYLDMPTPINIGSMALFVNRDAFVKLGNSTVDLVSGAYEIQDFVTTYHPVGETVPQFRYCRTLVIDFNVQFGYALLEAQFVVDHVIAADDDTIEAPKVVKPKTWKGNLFEYADDLTLRGLTTSPEFMKKSLIVNLSVSNPDRLETFFRYKRSGFARQASTTAEAGFNFGTL